jgi:hypothetical protein
MRPSDLDDGWGKKFVPVIDKPDADFLLGPVCRIKRLEGGDGLLKNDVALSCPEWELLVDRKESLENLLLWRARIVIRLARGHCQESAGFLNATTDFCELP